VPGYRQTWAELSEERKHAHYESKNRRRREAVRGKFIAVDGEAYTTDEGHSYVLLGSSTGDYIYKEQGLSTYDCVTFLLNLRKKNPGYKFSGFAFNYDVNMIIGDLTLPELYSLWGRGNVTVRLDDGAAYRLEWLPSKSFLIVRLYDRLAIEICDSFGFFQSSFVKALEAWKIADPGEHIEKMKEERADFGPKDKRRVISYCLTECRMLVELMFKLEDALEQARLRPAKWNGAGAVAAALLQREGVARHRVPEEDFPEPVQDAIMRAYFGGRVEIFQQGQLETVTNYDIISAYPYEALHLPTLHGEWIERKEYDSNALYALWLCEWDLDPDNYVMPFPHRNKKEIRYASNGRGWYHSKEVRAARRHYGSRIRVLCGWHFKPKNRDRPFSFVRDSFAERAKAKREGLASEKALKLGLNALYGKTAQGIGYRGKIPRFRSFFWAGMMTSGTRARLLDMAMQAPSDCVSISTDGIVFTSDPDFVTSNELGGIERTEYASFFIAQPGIYQGLNEDGEEFKKSRGFFLREIDFDDLKEGWINEGPYYKQTKETKRFKGLGTCLHHGNLSDWRTWPESTRTLSLYSIRKFYEDETGGTVLRLLPPHYKEIELSERYEPKKRGIQLGEEGDPLFIQGIEQPRLDL